MTLNDTLACEACRKQEYDMFLFSLVAVASGVPFTALTEPFNYRGIYSFNSLQRHCSNPHPTLQAPLKLLQTIFFYYDNQSF